MTKIAFLGAGNIASAIMGGLIANGHDASALIAFDPFEGARENAAKLGVTIASHNDDAVQTADLVLLCVKPNLVGEVLSDLSTNLSRTLVMSVAAGITTDAIAQAISGESAIIRCMPNTPALVQSGMTALFATNAVTDAQKTLAETVMKAVGEVVWVAHEGELDAVTAVSGSGPAYFFYLMETMIDAAIAEGLDATVARQLVLQTALGAAKMAAASDVGPDILRERVTSPGGTTQAAIETFVDHDFDVLVGRAVSAARVRSEELSG